MNDLKQYGNEPRLPPALTDLCLALVALVAVLVAYSMVADEPSRQIVVTTRASLDQQIAAERIKAAQEMARATECTWRDAFREERQPKRSAM